MADESAAEKIWKNVTWQWMVFELTFFSIIPWFWFNHVPYKFAKMPYRATVDSAILTALDPIVSPANSSFSVIRYDLSVNLRFRNKGVNGIWYRELSAAAFYNGDTMLGLPEEWVPTRSGNGRPKNTLTWQAKLNGTVAVRSSAAAELEKERAAGTVHVQVQVSLSLARKTWPLVPVVYGSYDCWLWFPPPGDGAPAIFPQATKCFPVK